MTEPVEQQPRQSDNANGAKEWLDALANGGCNVEIFLRGVGDLLQRTPDAGWDLLALVDQYYRRGKISAESFGILKSHLQGLLIGKGLRNSSSPLASSGPTIKAASLATPSADASSQTPAAAPRSAASQAVASAAAAPPRPTVRPLPETSPPQGPPESTRPPRALAAGDVLRGRYVVQELLGRGGMGTVFAAVDQFRIERAQGEQRVALKVLHTDVIKRPRLFAELRREFQHLQSLSHPNIVRVHEFDHDGGLAFFTMEYLSGSMLSRLLSMREAGLPRPYALAIIRDVGSAITHAHARGVVHGDLNPGNIFITNTGEVRVFDFGASHQLHRGPWVSELDNADQVAVATPLYASCQVLEGAAANMSDDIYALACVAYYLLAGDHPFHDNNALKARSGRQKPARPRDISGRQWSALKAGLQFDRESRPSDIQVWLTQLGLHGAAPNLPVLASLLSLRLPRLGGSRWLKYATVTAVIAACGWWTNQHVDTVSRTATNLGARVTSWFDSPGASRQPDPAIEPAGSDQPKPAEPPATAQEAAKPPSEARHEAAPPPPSRVAAAAPRTPPSAVTPPTATPPTASSSTATRPEPASPAPIPAAATTTPVATQAASTTPYTGPHARLELATDTVEVSPSDSVAHLVVRRTRGMRGEVSFTWWTESGTALPGRDFTPVQAHVETIGSGQNAANLSIPVVADASRQVPRNFYVVIDQPSDNAAVGPRTLTMVSLLGAN